jgi:diketogulonate reductase-like aldo/keto reductase
VRLRLAAADPLREGRVGLRQRFWGKTISTTDQHPAFLYGTAWKESDTRRCVDEALAAGFRGIDTANQPRHYHEAGVGEALEAAFAAQTLRREQLFLQTKFTSLGGQDDRVPYDPGAPAEKQVRQSFASSLEHLRTDYLDSYVLHGPSSARGLTAHDLEAWGAMEELQLAGKTRFIGASNMSREQLEQLVEHARVQPTFLQNRCYARRGWDREVREACAQHGIIYQGFSLLTANPEVFRHPDFARIRARVGCTSAQLVFSFALAIGMLPLTGTTDPTHMAEDLLSTHVELIGADITTIERLVA